MKHEAAVVTRRSLDLILLEQFRRARLDLHDLPRGVRALALMGYGSTFVFLILAVILEAFSSQLPSLQVVLTTSTIRVPILAVGVASASFALGWSYIMTAATECHPLTVVPITALFLLQAWLMSASNMESPVACASLLLLFGMLVLSIVSRRRRFWREHPPLVFAIWFALLFVLMASLWIGTESSALGKALNANLDILMLLAIAYWAVAGLGMADFSVGVSGLIVGELRRVTTPHALTIVAVVVLAIRPIMAWELQTVIYPWWIFDLFVTIPFWLWAIVLAASQRWNPRNAALLIGASLAWTLIIIGLSLALRGHDFSSLFLSATQVVPPILLFIGLTLTNVLGAGARYIRTDGRYIPRTARVLLLFGTIALVFSFMLFETMGSNRQEFERLVSGCIFFSIGLLGPVYLIRVLLRNSGRLLGEEHDT